MARSLTSHLALVALLAVACGESEPPPASAPAPALAPAASGPPPARHAMGPDGALNLHEEDRCPICAMVPQKRPRFAAGLELEDGRTYYTCGAGCLIRVHLDREQHLGDGAPPIRRAFVPDFFTGQPLDAYEAHWVGGSDVTGPMGKALVPLASEADADAFVQRHGGPHRFRLRDLDDARWREITGRPPAATTAPAGQP